MKSSSTVLFENDFNRLLKCLNDLLLFYDDLLSGDYELDLADKNTQKNYILFLTFKYAEYLDSFRHLVNKRYLGSSLTIAHCLMEKALTLVLVSKDSEEFQRFYDYYPVNEFKDYSYLETFYPKGILNSLFGVSKETIEEKQSEFINKYCQQSERKDLSNWYGEPSNIMLKAVLKIVDNPDQWVSFYTLLFKKTSSEMHTAPSSIESRLLENVSGGYGLKYYNYPLLNNVIIEVIRFSVVLLDYLNVNTELKLSKIDEYSLFKAPIENEFNKILSFNNKYLETPGSLVIYQ